MCLNVSVWNLKLCILLAYLIVKMIEANHCSMGLPKRCVTTADTDFKSMMKNIIGGRLQMLAWQKNKVTKLYIGILPRKTMIGGNYFMQLHEEYLMIAVYKCFPHAVTWLKCWSLITE